MIEILLLVTTATTAFACLYGVGKQRDARLTWTLFGLSAAAASAGHAVGFTVGASDVASWLQLGSYVLFAAGAAEVLHRAHRSALAETILDIILVKRGRRCAS